MEVSPANTTPTWKTHCEDAAAWWTAEGAATVRALAPREGGPQSDMPSQLGQAHEEAELWTRLGQSPVLGLVYEHELSLAQRELISMCSSSTTVLQIMSQGMGYANRSDRDEHRADALAGQLERCLRNQRAKEMPALFPNAGPFAQGAGSGYGYGRIALGIRFWSKTQRAGSWAMAGAASAGFAASAAVGGAMTGLVGPLCAAWAIGKLAGALGRAPDAQRVVDMVAAFEPRVKKSSLRAKLGTLHTGMRVELTHNGSGDSESELQRRMGAMMASLHSSLRDNLGNPAHPSEAKASAPVFSYLESLAIGDVAGPGRAPAKRQTL